MAEVVFVGGIILLLVGILMLTVQIGVVDPYGEKEHYSTNRMIIIVLLVIGLLAVFGSLRQVEKNVTHEQMKKSFERIGPQ